MNSINSSTLGMAAAERGLMERWRACLADLEGFVQRTADGLMRSVKFRVMDRVISLAGKNARLSGYDEELFTRCARLMDHYFRAATYYERHSAELRSLSIKSLLQGITEVFRARLKLFEAHLCGGEENPVAVERIKLLSAGVAYFMFSFNEMGKPFKHTRQMAAELSGRFTPEHCGGVIDHIQGGVLDGFVEKNYPAYNKAVQACLFSLNSLQNRKVLAYYLSLLSEEAAALKYVCGQAAAIERELGHAAGNSLESDIAGGFLSIVGEAKQYYDFECAPIIAFFCEAGGNCAVAEPEGAGSLRAACGDMLANSRIIAGRDYVETAAKYASDARAAQGFIEAHADLFIGQVMARADLGALEAESACRAKSRGLSAKLAAEAVASLFARQVSFYREHTSDMAALNENSIISGINETLLIKVEILGESIAAFDERQKALESVKSGSGGMPRGEGRKQLVDALFPIFREKFFSVAGSDEIVMDAFYSAAAEAGPVAECRAAVTEACRKEEERAGKEANRFLKDSVLYEISTFEEILQYSVSRLRESDNDHVKNYIDLIDENALLIENTLKKIGVAVIRPGPHDVFSGKGHEVLMAERAEGFAKGEIVKCITSGYRMGDQILIRANVIAAK